MSDRFSEQRSKLTDELPRYAGQTAPECKAVGITLRYPVYTDLTADQLEYYLYWRSTLGTPDFKRAAEGYTWLLVSELLNTEPGKISILCSQTGRDGSPLYQNLLGTAVECAMVFGTDLPSFVPWMAYVKECDFLSRAFCHPVSDIPPDALTDYVPDVMLRIKDRIAFARFAGTVLREYDEILIKKTGRNLRQTYLRPKKQSLLPFAQYAHLGKKVPVEKIVWSPFDDSVKDLANLLCDVFSGRPVPRTTVLPLKERLLSVAERVKESKEYTDGVDPFSKPEGIRYRRFGSASTSLGPSCLRDPNAGTSKTRCTMGDILTFSDMLHKGPVGFITSDLEHPSYNDLSRDQFAYYLYWRDMFREGRCLDTDTGYVNLYLTELINTDKGEATSGIIRRLLDAYGDYEGSLIGTTLMDHALCNGQPFTDYRVCMDRYVVNAWAETFIKGTNTVPLDDTLFSMMRSGSIGVRYIGRSALTEPIGRALQRILTQLSSTRDPAQAFGAERVTVKRGLYFGFDYLRGSPECKISYSNFIGNRKFTRFVDKVFQYAVSLQGRSDDTKRPPFTFAGINCAQIIAEELSSWKATAEKTEIRLDSDAIEDAESDLRAVTDMMKVSLDGEDAEEPIQTVSAETDDPWEAFAASLTDEEKEYVREVLEGETSARPGIEDAVNGKALTHVGDTVLEDGRPVEDYLDELRRMM